MNERWRKVIRFGIVQRNVFGEKPPVEVEYRLTPLGRRFLRILNEVRRLQDAVDSGGIPKTGNQVKQSSRLAARRS